MFCVGSAEVVPSGNVHSKTSGSGFPVAEQVSWIFSFSLTFKLSDFDSFIVTTGSSTIVTVAVPEFVP